MGVGEEWDLEGGWGTRPGPNRGLLQAWEGLLGWSLTPSLIPALLGFLEGDSPREVGDRTWLERKKCPENRTVPVGSGDVCSTVHGSYQLTRAPSPAP